MSESFPAIALCPHAEALVVIEVLPLCSLAVAQELVSLEPRDPAGLCEGRPLRCIAAVSCEDALALVEEAGHVRL